MATHTSTRRGILGAMAIASVVIAVPAAATAATTSPVDRAIEQYNRARDRLNNAPSGISFEAEERLSDLFTVAMHRLMDLVPQDGGQLARKIAALWQDDGDLPTEKSFHVILRDSRALA